MRPFSLAVAILALTAGCSSDRPDTLASLTDTERAELPAVDYAALEALLGQHHDKRVVLMAWSVNQKGCAETHQKLPTLLGRGAEAGPTVIALNLDAAAAVRARVLPLVRGQAAGVVNRVFDDEEGQMMLLGLGDPDWGGRLPAIWLFGPGGALLATFDGPDALTSAAARLAAP